VIECKTTRNKNKKHLIRTTDTPPFGHKLVNLRIFLNLYVQVGMYVYTVQKIHFTSC